jgi:hypothetical protein
VKEEREEKKQGVWKEKQNKGSVLVLTEFQPIFGLNHIFLRLKKRQRHNEQGQKRTFDPKTDYL